MIRALAERAWKKYGPLPAELYIAEEGFQGGQGDATF